MAVKSYDCNRSIKLTKNFNSKEFKCKGKGHIHNTLIDTDLVNQLQDFMNKNGYTKAIISSAYRCSQHNKEVGGSGSSTHTQGRAVDICFYIGNTPVDAKIVCCKAQDYGFKGIAYIDSKHVHLDNRTSGKYRGDERKGYSNNVPNGDFYKYFGITPDKPTPTPTTKYILTRLLYKGCSKGDDVKELQKALGIKADGIFGNDTKNAVIKFQKSNKLYADGKVGKDTAHALGWTYQGK